MAEPRLPDLTDEERATYEWQMWVKDHGEAGQRRLKASTALISRCGGLGGPLAYELAAAGIGKLIIAHAGNVKHSDLNRQLLMTHDWLGKPRIESIVRRLKELNPRLDVEGVPENISEDNVDGLVKRSDIVFDCAPLYEERLAMNRACVDHGVPMVECAMYDLEGQVTTILPGKTACLACMHPEKPSSWKRQFPVFGAVSGTAACIGAMEGIKILSGMGASLAGRMLYYDLREMRFDTLKTSRRADCRVCGGLDTTQEK